jgi:hypothetical protein
MKNLIKAILITITAFIAVCGVFYLAVHFINWFIGIASIVLFATITLVIKVELDEKDNEELGLYDQSDIEEMKICDSTLMDGLDDDQETMRNNNPAGTRRTNQN